MADFTKAKDSRRIFSSSEEDIIGKFLIACWKKKLRVPHETLYETLQKHLEKYPRPSKCKDNRPSSIWRMKFFERNTSVQEAYTTFKATASKSFDLVSGQMLASFLQDLALADIPSMVLSAKSELHEEKDERPQETLNEEMEIKAKTLEAEKTRKRLPSLKTVLPSPVKGEKKKHSRSKTGGEKVAEAIKSGGAEKDRKEKSRKSTGGLKLSSTLFSGKQAKEKPDASAESHPQVEKVSETKDKTSKKKTGSPAASKATGRLIIPANAVPLEPVKFVVDAKIEAMDCGKWYQAKIVEVDKEKQEVLVHFNGWGKRFDTIFPMQSTLIRGCTQGPKKPEALLFKVGDDVLSQWSDGTFYPGTVMSITKSGSYVVMFYDGLKKQVRPNMLKPITEKEKEASLKAAHQAYLDSLKPKPADEKQKQRKTTAITSGFRRYRTSANDREKRLAAKNSSDDASSPTVKHVAQKRKATESDDVSVTSQQSSPGTSPGGSPTHPEKYKAKKARLDKITHTLLDKVTTMSSTVTTTVATTTSSNNAAVTSSTSSPQLATAMKGLAWEIPECSFDDSDGSEAPLVIDEDRDKKLQKLNTKKSKGSLKGQVKVVSGDGNLHQLADAALSSLPSDESKVNSASPPASGNKKRKEASEALLQLALASYKGDEDGEVGKDTVATEKSAEEKKIDGAVELLLKGERSISQVCNETDVTIDKLRHALQLRRKIVSAKELPKFLSASVEDEIINWIHDMTDLGWAISDDVIKLHVRDFLSTNSCCVLFDDSLPVNHPSDEWTSDFLLRHPEIFPGRKKPLSRFRNDKEGFEDWLLKWLSTLRSYSVVPNGVYYCDAIMWDVVSKQLQDFKFKHSESFLQMEPKSKVTSVTCVGADGSSFPTFHVFPENSDKKEKDQEEKPIGAVSFSQLGYLTSDLFFGWLKNVFLQNVPDDRPLVLLVDFNLDELDFKVLKFADEQGIVLFKFLPNAATFLQHPDQKLFGRSKQQWKKGLMNKFMKQTPSKEAETKDFAQFYCQEFSKVATGVNIKMCFELTKLYRPMTDAQVEAAKKDKDKSKEKKNKRKRSKPVIYVNDDTESKDKDSNQKAPLDVPEEPANKDFKAEGGEEPSGGFPTGADKQKDEDGLPTSPAAADSKVQGKGKPHPDPEASNEAPKPRVPYKVGETVLAKWSDCRLYLATILKRFGEDKYRIRYFDGFKKTVRDDFLRPWSGATPTATAPPPKARSKSSETKPATKRRLSSQADEKPSGSKSKRNRAPSSGSGSRKTSSPATGYPESERIVYKKGETVLCRWTDRLMYPATVLKQTDESHYLVKYYDERKKVVEYSWLSPWKPVTAKQATSLLTANDVTTKQTASRGNDKGKPAEGVKTSSGSSLVDSEKIRAKSEDNDDTKASDVLDALGEVPEEELASFPSFFKVGDTVLSRWTDCRSYPASVLKVFRNGRYEVQFYDGMKRTVKESFLKPWDPKSFPANKSKPKQGASYQSPEGEKISSDDASSAAEPATGDKISSPLGVAQGHVIKSPFHKEFVNEAEINRFKCRVPGCTKVFRKESQLQQHHRHYHLQRYKLRDQEGAPHPKRKISKSEDQSTATKRRVSADYYSATAGVSPENATPASGEGPRSRGGKPPIDRMKMDLGTSGSADGETPSKDMDDSPHRKKRKRSGPVTPPSVVLHKLDTSQMRGMDLKGGLEDSATSDKDSDAKSGSADVMNEDIIQCVCGNEEEEGFMLQCESCLTWQHALCEGVSPPAASQASEFDGKTEKGVSPDGYVCKTCRDPPGVRGSQRYRYSNDFLNKGQLPKVDRLETESDVTDKHADVTAETKDKIFEHLMMATHKLMEELGKMNETLHGIRVKTQIADPEREHPLLLQWKDKPLAPDVQEEISSKNEACDVTEPGSGGVGESEPSETPTSGDKSSGKSVLDSVKSALMSIVKSVIASTSPSESATEQESSVTRDDEGGDDAQEKAEGGSADIAKQEDEKDKPQEISEQLWKPIEIQRVVETVTVAPGNGKDSSDETNDEEALIRSRGKLLSHINHLEECLSDRLVKLEAYVSGVESAFEKLRSSSNENANSNEQEETLNGAQLKDIPSPSYQRRLGELQSEIGVMYNDLDAVHEMLSTDV